MLKIPKKYKYEYVSCLPIELEKSIMKEIKKEIEILLLTEEEKKEVIESANNEKLCNLTDTIQIEWI